MKILKIVLLSLVCLGIGIGAGSRRIGWCFSGCATTA